MQTLNQFLNKYQDKVKHIGSSLEKKNYDSFGLDKTFLAKMIAAVEPFYRYYFRVETFGLENIPDKGRILLISNHSGQIPIDASMIGLALFLELKTPRFVRSMVERWVPELPFIGNIFNRAGQILGTPDNARRLLETDNALLVFPEGVRGINKVFKDRYKLASFGTGFLRLALETQTPIIPIAVVGAEEQIPVIANFKDLGKKLGLPALPIPAIPAILPSKYRIYFGAPIAFHERPDHCNEKLEDYVQEVKATIQYMLDQGVEKRKHIFW